MDDLTEQEEINLIREFYAELMDRGYVLVTVDITKPIYMSVYHKLRHDGHGGLRQKISPMGNKKLFYRADYDGPLPKL